MPTSLWIKDLRISERGLQVKKTGHHVPLDQSTLVDTLKWLRYFSAIHHLRSQSLVTAPKRRVYFYPDTPRPWYFAWPILKLLNYEIVTDDREADFCWQFEDTTTNADQAPPSTSKLTINAHCHDISKTKIGKVFEETFGYSLTVDPSQVTGSIVEKSEVNGAHDGKVIEAPSVKRSGSVYQRLIDNRISDEIVEDIRTTIIGGEPVLVFQKRRPVSDRFANTCSEVLLSDLSTHYTNEEIDHIRTFAKRLGLDCGGLDVLRDKVSGKLFIVDANKTDMGPPLGLAFEKKINATMTMAKALTNFIESRL